MEPKTYFGGREVSAANAVEAIHPETQEKIVLGEVLVEYADGKEPVFEAVNKEEWEAGKTEEPIDKAKYAEWFVKRTTPIRTEIHKIVEKFNPRFGEIERVLQWVAEAYKQSFRKAVEIRSGISNFETDGTFAHLMSFYPEKPEMPEDVADVLEVLKKHNIPVGQVLYGSYFQGIQRQLEALASNAFSHLVGKDDEHRRVNDLQDIFDEDARNKAEKAGNEPAPVEGDAPSNGEDNDSREDKGASSTEAPKEGV